MRQTILFTMMLLVTSSLIGQASNAKPSLTQQDYLENSKKQKLAGRILLIGGAGLMATGIIIPQGELVEPCYGGWFCNEEYENDGIKAGFILAGTISMLSSVPLFIIAGKNKRKAATVSFKNENTLQLYNQNLVYTWVPALRVKVDF